MSDNTTQHDELAREVWLADRMRAATPGGPSTADQAVADRLIAKGYRKPRTVTTVEELDALAKGATILDAGDMGAQWDGEMWSGEGRWWHSAQIALPATVLHEPEAEATR